MKDLTQSLREIAGIFESLSARYAVMGGIAVRIHGIPRPTHDVDFTVALARQQLNDFFTRAMDAGYTVAEPYLRDWVDQVAGMPLVKLRMYLEDHGIDVDIFLAESDFQQNLLARRQSEDLDGDRIWFVSPEDLILLKLIAGRPRDWSTCRTSSSFRASSTRATSAAGPNRWGSPTDWRKPCATRKSSRNRSRFTIHRACWSPVAGDGLLVVDRA
jgi:predicted nucleotidyltransferase